MSEIKKIAILTSGGDAPGMNAAIRAVVRTCAYHNVKAIGVYRGYQGMIENDFEELNARSVRNIINRGGTFLKSARSVEFRTPEGRKKAYENLKNTGADALIVIGGDGSFTGALLFSEEFGFPVMGIPGTIDNDIYGTTYTLGYDTALNTGIGGGAEKILIPEQHSKLEELLTDIEQSHNKGKTSNIIVVAEGDKTGKNVFELKEYIEKKHPEYDIRVSVLGHMQRGGAPTCFDRVLASRMGVKAVESLLEGKSNFMVGINNDKIDLTPLEKAIKGGESKLDPELMRIAEIMSV